MLTIMLQLIILFLVIMDPPASLCIFLSATKSMNHEERHKIAIYALLVAIGLSYAVLILGDYIFKMFSTTLDEFRVAGGIILAILGIKMTMGRTLANMDENHHNSGKAIASIIGTPLITGPAAITAILVSIHDYGRFMTGLAVGVALWITGLMFLLSDRLTKHMSETTIQIISTIFGLITISWGVKLITLGVRNIFGF